MRRLAISATALIGLFACSGGDDDGGPVTLVADPTQLVFGDVEVGMTSKAIVTLSTAEGAALTIDSVMMRPLDQLTWSFSLDKMQAGAGESIALEVEYHPTGAGASSVEFVVLAQNADPVVILVGGMGVDPADVRLGQAMFDFGDVTVGSSSELSSTLENRNGTPGTVTFDPGLNVDHCDANGSELNSFCVTFAGKTLDDGKFSIEGNETVNFTIRFIPLDMGVTEQATFELFTCPMDDCKETVTMFGTGQ